MNMMRKRERIDYEKIENAVRDILEAIGEDPNREGLEETPKRVAKMYAEVFSGLNEDYCVHLTKVFEESHEEIVLVKDIPFYSMCEHHLVPFFGKAHVAYFPKDGKVTGLSKLARTVDTIAKRPQLQERMTATIADAVEEVLTPHGVMVIVEAEHLCMSMRGVKKPGSKTKTYAVRGNFKNDYVLRQEVLTLIQN